VPFPYSFPWYTEQNAYYDIYVYSMILLYDELIENEKEKHPSNKII
jgi:hypothetical protein